jgi:vanillate O-demethylase monooxygenase subunit
MTFIKNIWYVAAWSTELDAAKPIGRTIIGEPVALYRKGDGAVIAMEDRCPHRHAPLSLGRIEGDDLKCMYHGLKFGSDGACKFVPGSDIVPPNSAARTFPAVERSSWIWVWPGDPAKADPDLVPFHTGLDDPQWLMRESAIDYAAGYELINDNLCDLSHLDYTHENTLGKATGAKWSFDMPKITPIDNGLLFERWFVDVPFGPNGEQRVDSWSRYRYLLPGIFLMNTFQYPAGAAQACGYGTPTAEPVFRRAEQQAVTPMSADTTRYLFATGVDAAFADPATLDARFAVVAAAFAEDKVMIEAQQKIWNLTSPDKPKAFIPQDKAPATFRRMVAKRLAMETDPSPADLAAE